MRTPGPGFDAAIRFAADLIRLPSPPGGEEAVARRVVAEMDRLGFDDAWTDDAGNAIGRIRGRGEAPPVMLSCHLDVVDAGEPEAWEHPPYGGIIAEGFLHGRGAMDIKGPLALQTCAAARFVADRPAGDLLIAHTVFEERGGLGMAHLLEGSGLRPGVVVIGEATGGDLCIGHRGRAEVLVKIRGRAGHASAPEAAANALDGVGPVLAAVRAFADDVLADAHPILGRSTIAATDVFAEPRSRNVIPDSASVVLDWRTLPGLDAASSLDRLQRHLRDHVRLPAPLSLAVRYASERQRTWTGLEQDWPMFGAGFLLEEDHPIVRAAAKAIAVATGRPPAIRPWRFATDGRHTCAEHGIPTIGYAPGDEGHAHTNRERLDLRSAREAFHAYPPLVVALFDVLRDHPG